MSHSLRPHGLQPTRLLCPWDFPGKSTGVALTVCKYNNVNIQFQNIDEMNIYMKFFRMFLDTIYYLLYFLSIQFG